MGTEAARLLAPSHFERVVHFLQRALTGERNSSELTTNGPGRPRYYSVICEPERDAQASIAGVVVVVFDISDRKRSEAHIRFLLSEVNHRSKNMLSVVSAIVRQTRAATHEDFVERFSGRIQGLAASHDLLANNEWQRIALIDLLRAQLAPFEGLIGSRILFDGPRLDLSAAAAQCLGIVTHELATNAAKYGALSNQDGCVEITWKLENSAADDHFVIRWTERGGPAVGNPAHSGYGSTVIKRMAELGLDGQVQLDFAPSGLLWRLACPASKIRGDAEGNDSEPFHTADDK
jgi:two-component sensor histidine kinase